VLWNQAFSNLDKAIAMKDNPVVQKESSRLAALESYQILDTESEQAFDDLTLLASHICETPIALFGLIDESRVWFKSKVGYDGSTIPREISFCTHTIEGSGCLIVPDLDQDERFHDHPLRAIHPEVRFYAGVPIHTREGHAIGAVCVLDQKPRVLSVGQIKALEAISRQAFEHLESRNRLIREKEVSRELSRSKKQLDDFFDLADDLLCIVEADGKFGKVSRSFEANLGYSHNEILNRPFLDFLHPDDKEATFGEFLRHAHGHTSKAFLNRYRAKDGRYVPFSWFSAPNGEGRIYAIARNISSQSAMEDELRTAKNRAEAAAAAKARFLANMSHEIRTPMNGIIGMSTLLIGSSEDPVNIERLNIIMNCGDTLLELIDDILDFSKLEVDKIEIEAQPFGLKLAVREVMDVLGPKSSQKNIRVEYEASPETPAWIFGDAVRFRQILMNLLSNAIKFTDKGHVTIYSSAQLKDDKSWILKFSVKDSGIGISKGNIDRLFSAFTQEDASTTRRFGGSGLGLAISKGLCEKMGGTIWVESEVGKGSEFFFTFVARETIAQENTKKNNPFALYSPEMAKKMPLRLLVAEDNRTNQIVITALLGKLGYHARMASDGQEALKLMEEQEFDLIFMDCHMPVMDGFEASKTIISKYAGGRRPQIIALTASTLREDIDHCYECGMDGFLSKPITMPPIFKALSDVYFRLNPSALLQESSAIQLSDSAPPAVLDSSSYFSSLRGLDNVAIQVLETSEQAIPGMLQNIKKAVIEGDHNQARLASHRLKGVLSTLYAESARQQTMQIEALAMRVPVVNKSEMILAYEKLATEIGAVMESISKNLIEKKSTAMS
jgi:PAS domain S-box-containing protein